jgi:diguanylate cyclase (GGDEF)-like protein
VLALGAPAGWLVARVSWLGLAPSGIGTELATEATLYAYLLIATATVFTAFGALTGRVVDALTRANQQLSDLALTDAITGLKNARYFHERLHAEAARAERAGTPLALIVGDLDLFKRFNDRHGHAVGDEVLSGVGRILTSVVRAGDSACRIGGEELAVICPATDRREVLQVAERLRAAIAGAQIPTSVGPLGITISLGVAVQEREHRSAELFSAADQAMYAAKANGRDRVVVAPSTPEARTEVG